MADGAFEEVRHATSACRRGRLLVQDQVTVDGRLLVQAGHLEKKLKVALKCNNAEVIVGYCNSVSVRPWAKSSQGFCLTKYCLCLTKYCLCLTKYCQTVSNNVLYLHMALAKYRMTHQVVPKV